VLSNVTLSGSAAALIVVEAQKEIASFRRNYQHGHFALASLTPDHALSALWSYRRNCPQDATAVL